MSFVYRYIRKKKTITPTGLRICQDLNILAARANVSQTRYQMRLSMHDNDWERRALRRHLIEQPSDDLLQKRRWANQLLKPYDTIMERPRLPSRSLVRICWEAFERKIPDSKLRPDSLGYMEATVSNMASKLEHISRVIKWYLEDIINKMIEFKETHKSLPLGAGAPRKRNVVAIAPEDLHDVIV